MTTCVQEIRVGDIGTKLELEIQENCEVIDISLVTEKTIILQRPDNTVVTRTGVFTTDGIDGKMYFETILSDLSMGGVYYIQAYIVLGTWQGHSNIGTFEVYENLE